MKTHICKGVGVYISDPECGHFETADHTDVIAFGHDSGIDSMDYVVARDFPISLVDPDEEIARKKEMHDMMDGDCPLPDGGSYDDPEESDVIRWRHAGAVKTVAEFRESTGRKWPPVYRVKVTTEAEEVSEAEAEEFWRKKAEERKWWIEAMRTLDDE